MLIICFRLWLEVDQKMKLLYVVAILELLLDGACAQEMETITGTIYCDNEFSFYVNGKFIVKDVFPIIDGHNAVNVSFTVPRGKDIVFAIEGIDWADNVTGLEFDGRCIGSGGLRAMFSNGVVTNNSWVCSTQHYGPVNWKECFGAQMVRNQSLQLHTACLQNSTPPLVGCMSRFTAMPSGWINSNFDDSHWEYALEYDVAAVGYGKPPTGCTVPGTTISADTDVNGVNATCPQNLNWGEAKFIWRPDLDLDNTVLCRYILRLENSSMKFSVATAFIFALAAAVIQMV